MTEPAKPDFATLAVQLLSAYVSNNSVPNAELAELIRTTKAALAEDIAAKEEPAAEPVHHPAVSAKASLASPDHIISMIDGKPYKTLKRHLSVRGMTPDDYRARFNLPSSYPMVAPNYSEHRRQVAKDKGLGRKPAAQAPGASSKTPAKSTGGSKSRKQTAPATTDA